MKPHQILLILVCSLFFLSLTNYILFNSLQTDNKTKLESVATLPAEENKEPEETGEVHHYPLVPEDPAKYGIISTPEGRDPQGQLGWDVQMKTILVDSKILETPEGKIAVEKMQTSRKKFDNNMSRVEKDIQTFEKELEAKPNDPNVQKRLQTLYKLKAIGKILEDKVVTLPDPVEKVLEGNVITPKATPAVTTSESKTQK